MQNDPSEPDDHRRQRATIDSPALAPKDNVNDNPKETDDKPTEDMTAIKQALASDKYRIPESLLLLKRENYHTSSDTSRTTSSYTCTSTTWQHRCTQLNRMPLRADEPSRLTFPL